MRYQEYQPKKILNTYKNVDGGWFWVKYSAHPYVGCVHGCEYCYEWGTKYSGFRSPDEFTKVIKVKTNAAILLSKELKKVPKELISVGDYQAAEKKYALSRKMLHVCLEEGFPVFIIEKSDLVTNDLDVISEINKQNYANVCFSIITAPSFPGYKQINFFENNVPDIERRLKSMEKFAKAGILTGTAFMPILPFIFDSEENIDAVCKATKNAGGKYVLAGSLTLEGKQQDRYYNLLRKNFSDALNKYISLYRGKYALQGSYIRELMTMVNTYCKKYGLLNHIPRYIIPGKLENNKIIAEKLYKKSRDLEMMAESEFKVMAYRKAANGIDSLEYDIKDVYETMNRKGLEKIPNIGQSISFEIEKILKETVKKEK